MKSEIEKHHKVASDQHDLTTCTIHSEWIRVKLDEPVHAIACSRLPIRLSLAVIVAESLLFPASKIVN